LSSKPVPVVDLDISSIVLGRDDETIDADFDDLVASIQVNGLREPILVHEADGSLIDGLRRIKVMGKLGHKKIKAVVTGDVDVMVAHLEPLHRGRQLTARRIYELNEIMAKANRVKLAQMKMSGQWAVDKRNDEYVMYRAKAPRALGLTPNTAAVERVSATYRAFLNGDAFAAQLLARVDNGEIPPMTAANMYMGNRTQASGYVNTPAEQRDILDAAVRNMSGIIKTLRTLQMPIRVADNDLTEVLDRLRHLRTETSRIIRKIDINRKREQQDNG
jgi:hypothetical protein